MDGNYGGTLPERLTAADTVIWLDLPTWLCLARVLYRTFRSLGRTRGPDMTPGCPERFDGALLRYVLSYRRRHRPRILAAVSAFRGRVVLLRTRKDVERFLLDLALPE